MRSSLNSFAKSRFFGLIKALKRSSLSQSKGWTLQIAVEEALKHYVSSLVDIRLKNDLHIDNHNLLLFNIPIVMAQHKLQSFGYFKGKLMTTHDADALIIHCMDFRFQDPFEEFVHKQNFVNGYDHVVLAGGVKEAAEVDKHVELAVMLHHIKKVLLVNHRTCGAYGAELAKDPEKELDKHIKDLVSTAVRLKLCYPDLTIETYFADIKEPEKDDASEIEMLQIDWKEELQGSLT